MRIAIVGIGGVGGYYGGKLALAYAGKGTHDIIFVARGKTLEAIRKNGLHLISTEGTFTAVPDLVSDDPKEIGLLDVVIFTVKSYGLDQAASRLAGNVHGDTVVLPLLNGVNIAERLRELLPDGSVLNGCAYISSHIKTPGVIEDKVRRNLLVFGPDRREDLEKFRFVEKLLKEADIRADLVEDAAAAIWTKYIFVESLAAITSWKGKTAGAVMEQEECRELLRGLVREVEAIAKVKGVNLPADIVDRTMKKSASLPYATKMSMQIDYEQGNPMELDIFSGYIVKTGREMGIKTPLHEQVCRELAQK
jgi:2-dehydropantoate 2-reductase